MEPNDLLGPRKKIAEAEIKQKSIHVPLDAAYPWGVGQFDYVERDEKRGVEFVPKPGTTEWEVVYVLARSVGLSDDEVNIDRDSVGSSHLGLRSEVSVSMKDNNSGVIQSLTLIPNDKGSLGKIRMHVVADHPQQARAIAAQSVYGLLAVLSFQANAPLFVSREIVRDPKTGWTRFWMVLPAKHAAIDRVRVRLAPALRPLYSLWRESRNSRSYFYKFLCLFKIIEGCLEAILPDIYRELKRRGQKVEPVRGVVAEDEFIRASSPEFIGKKFSRVRDELKERYRHALAHFRLDEGAPLDLDAPQSQYEYERLFPVVDSVARSLISEVERLTDLLQPDSTSKVANP